MEVIEEVDGHWWDIETAEVLPIFLDADNDAGITPSIKSVSSVWQRPDPPADVNNELDVLLFDWESSVRVNSAT